MRIEGGQALLAVDQLPRTVGTSLHHHRLEVVSPAVALADVVQELANLVLCPPVAALVGGHEEVAGDVTDRQDLEKPTISGISHQSISKAAT